MTTPERLAGAGLAALAAGGVSALTFDEVDARAGASPGTTAATFADHRALVQAVVDRIVAHDAGLWTSLGPLAAPQSVDELAQRFGEYVRLQVATGAEVVRARLELTLAHSELTAMGHLSLIEMMTVMLDRLDVPEPRLRAELLVALVDGVIIHSVTFGRDPQPTEALERAIRRVVG